ncbi:MAG: bifunctional metallophosphatase/5'-nucleotidase [Gammaproteobacteria bacterium]|nr:bifunctional metallophosphatase/5'-nucleotidase [Gammaproteobacteria bacterium]
MTIVRLLSTLFLAIVLASCSTPPPRDAAATVSIVGINDIHGELNAGEQHGGLVGISAYVNALRTARAAEGGAVLVVDAGDMWQGTLESNLHEGASMVEAYNALGVRGAAIGNHEFDFGPEGPSQTPVTDADDPRGALKARAREADFPLLGANLVDTTTDRLVDWDNVQPSVMVDLGVAKVGVIGILTSSTLQTTIAANTGGLAIASLAPAISREARALRADGATIVVVVAHAGGRCTDTSDPHDTSSCDLSSELLRVAREVDADEVDHIFGGHLNHEIAHIFDGVSVTTNLSRAPSFGRVDFRVDVTGGEVLERTVFPPQPNPVSRPARYDGADLVPIDGVVAVAERAARYAAEQEAQSLGVVLDGEFPLDEDMESALFNLFTEALLDSVDADIVLHNVRGGLRQGLPAGELTYGAVYKMFPFDNIVTLLEVSGRDLRTVIRQESGKWRRVGFAGMRVFAECHGPELVVRMIREDGSEIGNEERITLAVNDYLALGGDGILTPIIPPAGFTLRYDQPRTRDVFVDWLRQRGGSIDPGNWGSQDAPKWNLPPSTDCT